MDGLGNKQDDFAARVKGKIGINFCFLFLTEVLQMTCDLPMDYKLLSLMSF